MADEAKERGAEEGKILWEVKGNKYFLGLWNSFNFTYGIEHAEIYNISTQDNWGPRDLIFFLVFGTIHCLEKWSWFFLQNWTY